MKHKQIAFHSFQRKCTSAICYRWGGRDKLKGVPLGAIKVRTAWNITIYCYWCLVEKQPGNSHSKLISFQASLSINTFQKLYFTNTFSKMPWYSYNYQTNFCDKTDQSSSCKHMHIYTCHLPIWRNNQMFQDLISPWNIFLHQTNAHGNCLPLDNAKWNNEIESIN